MKFKHLRFFLPILLMFLSLPTFGQRIALKTNAVDWLLMSPNLSLETRFSSRVTFDLGISGNPIKKTPFFSDVKLCNLRINPEIRYWFNRPMARHFMGVAFTGGVYNLRINDHCYKGDIAAAGLTYGYALVLSRHWNVEFSLGLGLAWVWGKDYRESLGEPLEQNMGHWMPVPIRTGVSFSYIFR